MLAKPHKGGQRALYRHPARFQVVACGRRWGKTAFGKIVASEALFKYGLDVWWVAPTYKMSSAMWREFLRSLSPFARSVNAQERYIEFGGGQTLTVWTGESADTMRGGAPGLVIIDEAAMIRDAEMWPAVIRPTLSDKRGRAIFLSTPRGRNWFWELYNRGNDPLFPDYMSWNFPTVSNVTIPHLVDEVAEAQRTLPERLFRQEYLAEFIDDAGGVFRGVDAASTISGKPEPVAGRRYVGGVDWGRSNDFTVIVIMDAVSKEQVLIDRFNRIEYQFQRGRIKAACDQWKPAILLAEANSIGEPNIEALRREGLPVRPFQTTAQSKGPLIEGLALAIERGDVRLMNDRVQMAELQAYELERLVSGTFRYSAPDGGHDDTVIALALAWYAIANSGVGRIEANPLY